MDNVPFSSRKSTVWRENCAVEKCDSRSDKNLNVSFHSFPRAKECFVYVENMFGKMERIDKAKAWKRVTKIKIVLTKTKVCSRHFKKEDYLLPDVPTKRKVLKKTAVPSRYLPNMDEEKVEKGKQRSKRREAREIKKSEQQTSSKKEAEQNTSSEEYSVEPEQSQHYETKKDIDLEHTTSVRDIGVQIKSGDLMPRFFDFIEDDSQLSTATGIETFDILNCIVDFANTVYDGKSDHSVKMSLHDKIVMTYVKLKQNVSYSFLALMFKVYTPKHCSRVFEDMVHLLSTCLGFAIPWPSKDEISKNLPHCFKDFPHVRVVLDCTEIHVQNPKELCCQLITYSHYKGTQTCKFLTGVTPAGNISYVSKPYGGRASDKAIFENSELVNLLEPGDAVMIDKGFLIDEICQLNNWEVIRPPFLKNKKQFSNSESVLTAQIAKARVHIERSNERLKKFKILGTTMPNNLIPLVEKIFKIICATVNLSSPILKDDKFMEHE